MKPAPFEFHAPESLEEALALLARHGEEAHILAGGQSLVPLMNMRMLQPRILVSLNRCRDLAYLHAADGTLAIGAMARQAEVEESDEARRFSPLLAAALPHVGGAANRNRGTLCGSLAHADPAAEPPAVAVALGAEMVIAGAGGRRVVPAEDFFVAELTTCLAPGELLAEVRFPARPGSRAAFVELANRRHGFALVGIAVAFDLDADGRCRDVRLAGIGLGPVPLRLRAAEQVLEGTAPDAAVLAALAEAAREGIDPGDSFHADADYRRHLAGVLARRAVLQAAGREEALQ